MPKFTLSYGEGKHREDIVVEAPSLGAALRALAAKPLAPGDETDEFETVDEVLVFYAANKPITARQQKRRSHTSIINRLRHLVGTDEPLIWDQDRVDRFAKERLAAGWAPASVQRFVKALHAAFAFAVRRKKLSKDQPLDWSFSAPEVRREGILSREDLAKIFRAERRRRRQKDPRLRWQELFLWIAVYTAQRPSAIVELRWDQIDWTLRTINFIYGPSTGHKRRTVSPIAQALMPVLRRGHRERNPKSPFVLGREDRTTSHVLRGAALVAGVDLGEGIYRITNYSLRHTTASLLLREGVAPYPVAGLLGISVQRLLKTYAKHVPSHLQESIDRF